MMIIIIIIIMIIIINKLRKNIKMKLNEDLTENHPGSLTHPEASQSIRKNRDKSCWAIS